MEAENSKFNEFKFNSDAYISTISTFAKNVKENDGENIDYSKEAFHQLDLLYTEKMKECSVISADIKRIRAENSKADSELEILKTEDEQISNLNLKDGNHLLFAKNLVHEKCFVLRKLICFCSFFSSSELKRICKGALIQNNEDFISLTNKVQTNLGFKLRLSQCHDSHLWAAKFFFDISESENSHFVQVLYNTQDESFTCTYTVYNIRYYICLVVKQLFLQCLT